MDLGKCCGAWREHHFGVDLGEEAANTAAGVEDVGDANEHLGELTLLRSGVGGVVRGRGRVWQSRFVGTGTQGFGQLRISREWT